MTTVAAATGPNRYETVRAALDLLSDVDLGNARRVLIKPNLVSVRRQLASTHVDAVRAVLEWLRERYSGEIIIGEGSALAPTMEGFRRFGYEPVAQQFGATLVDLNADPETVAVKTYDYRLQPQELEVSATAARADVLISVGPPKTHDYVIMTASIKNTVMGALIARAALHADERPPSGLGALYAALPGVIKRLPLVDNARFAFMRQGNSDKMRVHQTYALMHLNIFLVARVVRPHLAVIDGWEAMEGDGPTEGDPVPLRVALASTDPVAADAMAAQMMGLTPREIGYLWYAHQAGLGQADLSRVRVVGNADVDAPRRRFRLHSTYPRQRQWRDPRVDALFQASIHGHAAFFEETLQTQ